MAPADPAAGAYAGDGRAIAPLFGLPPPGVEVCLRWEAAGPDGGQLLAVWTRERSGGEAGEVITLQEEKLQDKYEGQVDKDEDGSGERSVADEAVKSNGANADWFDLTDDDQEDAELLHFHNSKSGDEKISLREYADRMKAGQHDIFYITGANIKAMSAVPRVKTLRKKGLEVLYIVDPVEEHCVQQLKEFDGKPLKVATKEDQGVGILADPASRDRVAGEKCIHTSKSGDEKVSLKEHVDRVGVSQGEYCVQQLREVDGKECHKFCAGEQHIGEIGMQAEREFGDQTGDSADVEAGGLLRRYTSEFCVHSSESGDDQISLKEYVDFMRKGQNVIYYSLGESIEALASSPAVEACRIGGFEVLFILDPVDEYFVQQMKEFDGFLFKEV